MPRDGSGVYSLPVGYLAVTGSPILASQHNPALEDVRDAITGSLPRDGAAGMTGDLKMATGTKINWNSGDVTVTHSTNTLAFAGASVGVTFDGPLTATAIGGTTGTFTGILAGLNGIVSALDKPIYLYSASVTNTAYWVADTATGNVRLVTGTSAPTTRITVAADSGNVTIATGTLTVSAAIASGAGLSGTSGTFSTSVTVGTTLGVTGTTTLAGATATSFSITSTIGLGAGAVGFYGTTPIIKQTGVAVSAAGIHAALVALGLIT